MTQPPKTGIVLTSPLLGRSNGAALVVVLSMLVLVAGLSLALFSRALDNRKISAASVAKVQEDQLAQAVMQIIEGDITGEMEAGSEISTVGATRILKPITSIIQDGAAQEPTLRSAPSMIPQRVADEGLTNVIKVSRAGEDFFSVGEGYQPSAANGQARASTVSTSSISRNGRSVPVSSWQKVGLVPEEEFSTRFQEPDWIYLNREGKTPTEFDLTGAGGGERSNDDFVIGRYAYVIYDVGGLLDINVVGNALPPSLNHRKGRLHQVDLSPGIGDPEVGQNFVGIPGFRDFVNDWRWPLTGDSPESLFDPRRDFTGVQSGEQAFVGRQDLIDYTNREDPIFSIPQEALQYLATSLAGLDAPYFEHQDGVDSPLNASLLDVRFSQETELGRGADPAVTVPAGMPVMPRRFPLSKLDLFQAENFDEASMRYYFGLERAAGGAWEYVAGIDVYDPDDPDQYLGTRIARLEEVAALGREPNFFEVLQAVIDTDSLGRNGGDAHSFSDDRDSLRNLQILQIGANIIDQWDADDVPTTLLYPAGDNTQPPIEIYGVENLPYIHQVAMVPHRPEYNQDLFQLWLLFDLWNPNQNAKSPPVGIGPDLRIVASGGPPEIALTYWLTVPSNIDLARYFTPIYNASAYVLNPLSVAEAWNSRQQMLPEFLIPAFIAPIPGESGYTEPRTVALGGASPSAPEAATSAPGILLVELDLSTVPGSPGTPRPSAAIPPKNERSRSLQISLNNLWDRITDTRYEANPDNFTNNASGEREYPLGTEFTQFNDTYWTREDRASGIVVYANFATKAHNRIQFWPNGRYFSDLDIELQARVNGEWKTYQRIEDWFRTSNSLHGLQNVSNLTELVSNHTHHSETDANLSGGFYRWRAPVPNIETEGVVKTMLKMDPRSSRFGLSMSLIDALGFSARSTTQPWNRVKTDGTNWVIPRQHRTGVTGDNPAYGFEHVRRTNGNNHFGSAFGGVVTNHPELLNGEHPLRYADRDGVIRPGDGYFGARPTLPGRLQERSVILNRPFRSVGELGYIFRDLPWKTLDFSTRYSADLGLLDVFTLDEAEGTFPVVAGKVNLNSASAEVLAALLRGSAEQLEETNPDGLLAIDDTKAWEIARSIVEERSANGPFLDIGDLVGRVFHSAEHTDPLGNIVKAEREAAIRTLTGIGTLRTWNLLIDVVVQSGRFPPNARNKEDFLVKGQDRYWLQLAMDRITGEVLSKKLEVVDE